MSLYAKSDAKQPESIDVQRVERNNEFAPALEKTSQAAGGGRLA